MVVDSIPGWNLSWFKSCPTFLFRYLSLSLLSYFHRKIHFSFSAIWLSSDILSLAVPLSWQSPKPGFPTQKQSCTTHPHHSIMHLLFLRRTRGPSSLDRPHHPLLSPCWWCCIWCFGKWTLAFRKEKPLLTTSLLHLHQPRRRNTTPSFSFDFETFWTERISMGLFWCPYRRGFDHHLQFSESCKKVAETQMG